MALCYVASNVLSISSCGVIDPFVVCVWVIQVFRQSSMYSCLSSITIVLPLSVLFIIISLLFCMLHSAVRSSGVRLSHGCLYLRCFKVSLVRAVYLLRLVSDGSSTCVGYSVIVMMSLKVVQSNKVIIWY